MDVGGDGVCVVHERSSVHVPVYGVDELLRLKHDYDPRAIPTELRNFRMYLTKSAPLVEQLGLLITEGDIVRISDQEVDEDVIILRKLKSALNKITAKTYTVMFEEIKRLSNVRSEATLLGVTDALIANIKAHKDYAELYSHLIRDVNECELWQFPGDDNFNTVVLNRCMTEVIEAIGTRDTLKAKLDAEPHADVRFEVELKYKAGAKSLMCFVAHMFCIGVVGPRTITDRLLLEMAPEAGAPVDAYNVEFMATVYPIVADKAWKDAPERMVEFRERVRDMLAGVSDIRIKFMVKDLITALSKKKRT